MDNQTTHVAFFSPTQTTKAIVQAIAQGVGGTENKIINLTYQAPEPHLFGEQDLVVIGMPVYGGRLPKIAVERFQALKGQQTPAVAVVVYGNRAYEDALVELCDLCVAQEFKLVSAAAFVGQHSFSSEELPLSAGRPDLSDLGLAEALGCQVFERLRRDCFLEISTVPGDRPYKSTVQPSVTATAIDPERCIRCGACTASCPVQSIKMIDGIPQTGQGSCIWCMACVQVCPTGAQQIVLPKIHESALRLHKNFSARKEPEVFPILET